MSLLEQIQQDQAKRQALVNWHQDQLAIAMLKKADHGKINRLFCIHHY